MKKIKINIFEKLSLFKSERFVFDHARTEKAASNPAESEPTELSRQDLEAKLNENGKGVEIGKNAEETIKALANKAYPDDKDKKLNGRFYDEKMGALNTHLPKIGHNLKTLWDYLKRAKSPCSKITIEDGYFVFLDKDDKKVPIYKDLERKEMVKIGAEKGVKIDVMDSSAVKPEMPAVTPPGIRTHDAAAEQFSREYEQKKEKGKTTRERVLGDTKGGQLKFTTPADHKLTIGDIYPDAKINDIVDIKYPGTAAQGLIYGVPPKAAPGSEPKWYNRKSPNIPVKIYNGAYLSYVDYNGVGPATTESQKFADLEPHPPENTGNFGYLRIHGNLDWQEIAKSMMCLTTVENPTGGEYKKIEQIDPANINPASPGYKLAMLGWDPNNAQDVLQYSSILKEHNKDKLFVWIIDPGKSPGQKAQEEINERQNQQKKAEREANERRYNEGVGESSISQERARILEKYRQTLIENKNITLPPEIINILQTATPEQHKQIWDAYWKDKFKGKAKIMEGCRLLGISEKDARDLIYKTITNNARIQDQYLIVDEEIDFEDLLDASIEMGKPIFKDYEGDSASFHQAFRSDFVDEYEYHRAAYRVSVNIQKHGETYKYHGMSEDEIENYEDGFEKYEPDVPESARGNRWPELENILTAAAYIMEGIQSLKPTRNYGAVFTEAVGRNPKAKARKETYEKTGVMPREHEKPTENSPEETFLQTFFHPQNSNGDIADNPAEKDDADKKDPRSKFDKESSESVAYAELKRMYCNNGKWDKHGLTVELNYYLYNAISKYRGLKGALKDAQAQDKKDDKLTERLAAEVNGLKSRYGLDANFGSDLDDDGNMVNRIMDKYSFSEMLIYDHLSVNYLRAMLQDGFLIRREQANGNIEEAPEVKNWVNYEKIIKLANGEGPQGVVRQMIQMKNPDGTPVYNEAELREAAKTVDNAFKNGKIDTNHLFDINVGMDRAGGKFQHVKAGISVPFDLPKGFHISIGVAYDAITHQPMIGAVIGKEIDLTENWELAVQGAAGLEPFAAKVSAGGYAGFSWASKGEASSAWREKFEGGMGLGSAMSLNLSDIYLGPYLAIQAGQFKDAKKQYGNIMHEQMIKTGFAEVETAGTDVAKKAAAIMELPNGVGTAMLETKYNLKWTNEQLVTFYDENLKGTLEQVALNFTHESVGGTLSISDWGIGGTIDPVKLAIMLSSLALPPPITAVLAFAFFGKLGIVVGNTIKFDQELTRERTTAQEAADTKLIKYLEEKYPGVKIELSARKLEAKDRIVSHEFAGSRLENIIYQGKTPDSSHQENFGQKATPEGAENFEATRAEFEKHHIRLEKDPETQMYVIEPTEVQSYRIYADPAMASGHGLILKGDKILVATTQDLTQLFIKRFDYMYPREVDGAVQHTIITISDNPQRTMGEIEEGSAYFLEREFNLQDYKPGIIKHLPNELRDEATWENAKRQSNVQTYGNLLAHSHQGGEVYKDHMKESFYHFTDLGPEAAQKIKDRKEAKAKMDLSDEALGLMEALDPKVTLDGLKMSPEQFLGKAAKPGPYYKKYRELSTNAQVGNDKKIEGLIRKENEPPAMTQSQVSLYMDSLWKQSMSELHGETLRKTILQRLDWAEKVVYEPFFSQKLAELRKEPEAEKGIPQNIDGKMLAKIFIAAIRQHIEGQSRLIKPGESVITAVGTAGFTGQRLDRASTGLLANHTVIDAYDYSSMLDLKSKKGSVEQKLITLFLLKQHNEKTNNNNEFLNSRIAKKLFFLGKKGEEQNPLIDIIGIDKYKDLLAAYKQLAGNPNQTLSLTPGQEASVTEFHELCDKIRKAQTGFGIHVKLDGEEAMAIEVNGYYIVIKTHLQSGAYEQCGNPTTTYNEEIAVYPPEIAQRYPGIKGGVASDMQDVRLVTTERLNVQIAGAGVIGQMEVKRATTPGKIPPGEIPPGKVPQQPKPEGGPTTETNQAKPNPGVDSSNTKTGNTDTATE